MFIANTERQRTGIEMSWEKIKIFLLFAFVITNFLIFIWFIQVMGRMENVRRGPSIFIGKPPVPISHILK